MSRDTRASAPLRRWLLVGSALALLVLHACTLSRDGTATQECTGDAQCEDGNLCTDDVCSSTGFCESHPTVVDLPQVVGDCLLAQCDGGVQVLVPADDPVDDGNDCTADLCEDGVPQHDHLPDGVACDAAAGAGHCVLGECKVVCDTAAECDDEEDCTLDVCDALTSSCDNQPIDNEPAPVQVAGDCHQNLCEAGASLPLVDDSDLPVDGEPCTYDLCAQGLATNPPVPMQQPCSSTDPLAKVCNDSGECVQCNSPSDCSHLPPDDDCKQRVCNGFGDCVQYNTPIHTPVNQQQPGDCRLVVCDGNGNTQIDIDDTDLPVDGNDCTEDVCSGGNADNPPEPFATPCGQGYCNGDAANPLCNECNVPANCGTDSFCRIWACTAGVCQVNDTADGTVLPSADQTAQDCLEVQCNGQGTTKTVPVYDPIVDGIECTDDLCNGGTPVNPSRPVNTPCIQGGGSYCDGGVSCVECNDDGQCTAGDGLCEQDRCQSHVCAIVDDAQGVPAPLSYQTSGDCLTVVCDGAGEVQGAPAVEDGDLPVDGNACTSDLCSGGVPDNPEEPAGTSCTQNGGSVCNGDASAPACVECADSSHCDATQSCDTSLWICELNDGQTCAQPSDCFSGLCVDTRCCDAACGGSCEACDVAGSLGICTAIPFGQDPAAECAAGACDGQRVCKLDDGQGCSGGGDCLSGLCVDGVCCNALCGGTCEACDLAGSVGSCTPVPFAQDPDGECTAGACDGAGSCKLDAGEGCGVGGDCLTGLCVDGICCGETCGDTCEACIGAGVCTPYAVGTDPEGECGADECGLGNACRCNDLTQNGAESDVDCGGGVCSACAAGLGCNQPSDCQSGVCTGGICQVPDCGDGVVNGTETCDFGDPATPCCAPTCDGVAPLDTVCGSDPDGSGCAAPPRCSGIDITLASCQPRTQADATLCTTNGLFCDGAEACQGGACLSPGNPCSGADGDANCAETCDEAADTCAAPDPNGSPCSDGVHCNGTETCNGGVCGASTGDPCAGPDGDADCNESCDEGTDSCTLYDGDGVSCDDAGYCNGADTCQGGTCSGHAGDPCAGPDGDADCSESCDEGGDSCTAADPDASACSDGSFCNGTETCTGGVCGDSTGDPCLGPDGDGDCNESCDEGTNSCSAYDGDLAPCDDTSWCNGTDVCAAGSCSQHVGDPCLGPDGDDDCNESCDEGSDTCTGYDGDAAACDDAAFCNGADSCSAGFCTGHDGDPCPGPDGDDVCNESCDESADSCTLYDGDGVACGNGSFCDGTETCNAGVCGGSTGDPCPGPNGDDDCNESCDEDADSCSAYDGDFAPCDDTLWCNGTDVCAAGSCTQHVGDPCGGPDGDDDCNESCDEGSDTCSAYDGDAAPCDDVVFCNGADSCSAGSCDQHDGDPCPGPDGDAQCNESCDEVGDSCTLYDGDAAPCDDGFACTPTDACAAGSCAGTGSVCGDGVVCPPTEVCDDHNTDACGTCSADCTTDQSSPPPNDCPAGTGCVDNSDCTANCTGNVCN